jgi:hypothetical protein
VIRNTPKGKKTAREAVYCDVRFTADGIMARELWRGVEGQERRVREKQFSRTVQESENLRSAAG